MRMAAVANCRMTYITPLWNTARPNCENTVSSWLGYGRRWWASTDTPKNSDPRMSPIHTSVVAAFLDSGRRKAGTPLEMASTPVRATAPDEKPLRMRNRLSVPPVATTCSAFFGSNTTGWMWWMNKACVRPTPTRMMRMAM